jgi:hypothetical protein
MLGHSKLFRRNKSTVNEQKDKIMNQSSKENVQPEPKLNIEQKPIVIPSAQVSPMQCKAQGGQVITVFVKYKDWVEAPHPMLPDSFETFTKIVEVEKLTDLNNMFSDIVDVKILK